MNLRRRYEHLDHDVGPAVMKALDKAGVDAPAIASALAARVTHADGSPMKLPRFDEGALMASGSAVNRS